MNFASFTSAGTGVFGPSAGPYSFSATASISGTGTLSGMGNISSQNSSINIDNIEVNNPFDW
ncbi:MAG: hypothetical protein N2254_09795, partial [bacterium]|nr:hypothetical protein [bacterium]